jgi:oxygen-dependent protoporphyrinogen oxidase
VAGASVDGVGIPACVASGERAAEDVHKVLEEAAA